jgi:hypothetical protein
MTKISVVKGGMNLLVVLVSYLVSIGATSLTTACGIDVPLVTKDQATVAIVAGLSSVLTGGLNWWKHRRDPKPVSIPKV